MMATLSPLQFMTSASRLSQCPPDVGIEVAFWGRSNAGKSSAINTIACRRRLAHTSKTPGHTQLLNFYGFEGEIDKRLVDLPGFGYAKVPEKVRQNIERMLGEYLYERQTLAGIIFLMDIRRPMTFQDRDTLDLLNESECPVHILLTKSDKLKRGPANSALLQLRKSVEHLPHITAQTFSSLNGFGVEEAQEKLVEWLGMGEE